MISGQILGSLGLQKQPFGMRGVKVGTQESLWSHPGGTQGTWHPWGILEANVFKTYVFVHPKSRHQQFRVRGAKVTLTKYGK